MSTNVIEMATIQAANKLAEAMPIEMVPQVLVNAMAGLPATVAGVPNDLVSEHSPNESDSPVKGLILSKEHIIKIKTYVATGLVFPTEISDITRFLKYDSDFDATKYPGISPAAFQTLFTAIKGHCSLWSGLEADIKKTGTSLNIFGQKFVTTGRDVTDVIDQMPIMERIKKLKDSGKTVSVPFGEDDAEITVTLLELLDILKEAVAERQTETRALLERLIAFRETMDNVIVPQTGVMNGELQKLELDGERAKLLARRETLTQEIKTLDEAYKKMVGYAFTGAAGLAFGVIGIVSWAITGGIFGEKAEKTRKERNKKEEELDQVNKSFESLNRLISFVGSATDRVTNLSIVINDAVTGVHNLEVLWDAVAQYIDDSAKQLAEIKESSALLVFNSRMKSAVGSWENVRDITGELVRLFEAAAKEALTLADKAAQEEKQKGVA